MARLYSFLLIAVFFSACAASNNPPSWFLKAQNSPSDLYGYGSAKSLAAAKNAALNDIAQNLSTQISSQINVTNSEFTSNNKGISDTNLQENINLKVKNFNLENLKIQKQEYKNGNYFVLVKIAKRDLISSLNNEINQNLNELKSINCDCVSLNDFNRLDSTLKDILSSFDTLKILDPSAKTPNISKFQKALESNYPKPHLIIKGKVHEEILGELAKLFSLNSSQYAPSMEIKDYLESSGGKITLTLYVNVKNCNGNILFNTTIKETQKNEINAYHRAGIVLFKELNEFGGSKNSDIPKI